MGRKLINTKFNKMISQNNNLAFLIAQIYYDETNNQLLLRISQSFYEKLTQHNMIARVVNHQELIDLSLTTKEEYSILIPFYNSILFMLDNGSQITLPTI